MPFKKNSFDVVWNQGVLEHFKNPVPAMKEMYRVTKNGGYVIIYIPAFLSPLHLVWIFLSAFGLKKLWPFDEQDFYTRKQFKEFMRISGFKDFKIKRLWIKSLGFSQVGYVKKQ
jgi:ubiquinone/menaquinone biosynthesis C-methylase UbiE